MYKRIYSLKTRYNFRKALRNGNTFDASSFILKYIHTPDSISKKFGIIVSTRFSKSAVEQNKVRRLFAKAIKENLGGFPKGRHYVFVPKKIVKIDLDVKKISSEINTFLSKMVFS